MSPSTISDRLRASPADGILGVAIEPRTYKNLCYLLLAIPLGFAYGFILLFGFLFGAILSLFGIGLVILLAVLVSARVLAGFERVLANALLDLELERPEDTRTGSSGLWGTFKRYLEAASTWRGVGFLVLKSWLAVVAFVLLIVFATLVSLVSSPLRYPHEVEFVTVNDEPIAWAIGTLPEAALAAFLGLVGLVLFAHVSNAVAYVAGRMALAMLDGSASTDEAEPPTEPESSDGSNAATEPESLEGRDEPENADPLENPNAPENPDSSEGSNALDDSSAPEDSDPSEDPSSRP
ncbi:histidine kinase [Natrarchaeobius halalkaliphilus]|uniref:Histidine kinase n=1 Tax=Natrarchaeobius halalkaliphilus TaxID=1679091 RepID=A0A3N6LSU5_9EURY|nr:sensor domain-containing protein [Natrarchaeobius halalkaliphilus]RQG93058.1 histidine kinase [Natrarchaeobius halalkaliphilus]